MRLYKKPFLLLALPMKTVMSGDNTASNLRGKNIDNNINSSVRKLGERRQTRPCKVIVLADTPVNGNVSDEQILCELDPADAGGTSGIAVPFEVSSEQDKIMHKMFEEGELISGVSTFQNPNVIITEDEKISVPPGIEISLGKNQNDHRNLAIVTGNKPVLAVRVTALDYDVVDEATLISDNIFGSNGDPNNLASQLHACSMNTLTLTTDYDVDITQHLEAPGVISVNINIPLEGNSDSTVRNAITTAVQNKLGFSLPGPFQQVMYIVRGCYPNSCSWAAYAYINSWNSVYQGNYYKYTGVQVHEFGHNFNLAHSGMNGATYTDHTCMMGNPLYSDDVGRMCYNPAKNWQIGWYNQRKVLIDPRDTPTWRGKIVGISDYLNNPENHPVVIKIETRTSTDHFVGFNRATGVNADNDLCDNCVTIIESGNNGEGYSQSWNLVIGSGGLIQGQEYTFTNWQGLGSDLTIHAHEINLSANPGYADVSISLAVVPTFAPTPCVGGNMVKVEILTDNYPSETSWELKKDSTNSIVLSGSGYGSSFNVYSDETCADSGSFTFTINDSFGDGICCAYGEGYYRLFCAGTMIKEGGAFTTTDSYQFTCSESSSPPTPVPTPLPTAPPTPLPTASPTASPTFAPTSPPTPAPTFAPTSPPTPAPTASPTASPTFAPTSPPTPAPTSTPTPCPVCGNGDTCCEPNVCDSGGKPENRGCSFNGPAPPTAAPTVPPPTSPTACPICSVTGEECCGTCRDWGKQSDRGCL